MTPFLSQKVPIRFFSALPALTEKNLILKANRYLQGSILTSYSLIFLDTQTPSDSYYVNYPDYSTDM
jgi:hypothetical protein